LAFTLPCLALPQPVAEIANPTMANTIKDVPTREKKQGIFCIYYKYKTTDVNRIEGMS